jgi:hypothetical protein
MTCLVTKQPRPAGRLQNRCRRLWRGRTDISLDTFIISATSYQDIYPRYDDWTWDRARFADKQILFPERESEYDYMEVLLGN